MSLKAHDTSLSVTPSTHFVPALQLIISVQQNYLTPSTTNNINTMSYSAVTAAVAIHRAHQSLSSNDATVQVRPSFAAEVLASASNPSSSRVSSLSSSAVAGASKRVMNGAAS